MATIHYHVKSIPFEISSSRENESAKFWLNKLNELKFRGVEGILLTCVDGLTRFSML
ncbi:transposase [Cetobacterium sp.]|uniref:transposase n=1 Tax=Cetobacterium sp. TaxID=2071632 RepID=UPI003FA5C66A